MQMKHVFVFSSGLMSVVMTALLCLPASAASTLPFHVPEQLTYELAWEGVYAGTSTLSISMDGNDGYKIASTANSADYISIFYKVRDMVESITGGGSFASRSYEVKSHEGRHVKDLGVLFAGGNGRKKTSYIDYLSRPGDRRERDFKTPPGVMDPLSSFFYVRTLPLVVGKSVYVTIFDDEKVWNVEVKVLKKERVQTWLGSFNTILIQPLMKSSGIFRRNGAIYIWVTDDAMHMPVMLESKVKVGSIKAILEKASFGK